MYALFYLSPLKCFSSIKMLTKIVFISYMKKKKWKKTSVQINVNIAYNFVSLFIFSGDGY